ncbi:Transmembrane transcriptional regulator (anti-sigma factor RsiW) [Enhydrobacter aerosaccus]|uniref:Transmembrane transcriptional regulator (Anti-sigma factor RsiW) n=1 Tax=Enhydrobacter aerosaccus TaxID=225324 RepID=A0A1T4SGP7_9HYPH|nr:anti-sigma factor [Enhydrobacter aerosaccus]SKA27474.1 Transmembrane transcriptional regulator (anti-sigma factor RsiW) [Enhydrobacter aerosaccus]
MDCATCESMVEVYLDGELSAAESAAFEQALERCPACRERLEEARALSGLLRDLPAESAPDLLRARVERDLRAAGGARPAAAPRLPLRWMATAASLLVAASLGWMGGMLSTQQGRDADELVSGYLRVAASDHPVDVVSSDRHTVKPWFAGRIDYSPPVHDLTTDGFPLLGGRIDVYDGRKVAVLVYGHNQHKLALTLWPASADNGVPPDISQRDGFVLAQWRHGGFEMRAVSDVGTSEMESFAKAIDRTIDSDR